MTGRTSFRLVTAALAIGFHTLIAASAMAHSLTITASAVCGNDTGFAVINYTVGSWSPNSDGSNSQIDVSVNGFVVASGAFKVQSGNTFSGSVQAPSGSSAVVSALAVGNWGDNTGGGQSASTTVAIPTDCGALSLGRFTGGGSQIKIDGVRVTKGLTIHCDLLLSNNLELNWGGGHNFHMTEHITTVSCSDDPTINQAPPAAPLDTLIGIGVGSYDNVDGYTVQFTLVDYGEPGSSDRAAFKIFETANPLNVVLDLPLTVLSGGNLQAHFDQPHK